MFSLLNLKVNISFSFFIFILNSKIEMCFHKRIIGARYKSRNLRMDFTG